MSGVLESLIGHAPALDLARWNEPRIRERNNCYNYALDLPTTAHKAQPGLAYGVRGATLAEALAADGLIKVDPHHVGYELPPGHLVAAATGRAPFAGQHCTSGFHMWRLDSNGLWSHKPNAEDARFNDWSGELIYDPRMSDNWQFTNFVGYFWVGHQSVRPAIAVGLLSRGGRDG